eukprot:TRINITY_DN20846_c0_g1_i1.p1 TRINITY_DN20846_c0_g1~~TRINITY_DN20846_c0_g1_i1.p1  ORF type:complete len:539 (-),score=93.02 TRINITY_DN20846_c0_g1_i1:328-1944(-)
MSVVSQGVFLQGSGEMAPWQLFGSGAMAQWQCGEEEPVDSEGLILPADIVSLLQETEDGLVLPDGNMHGFFLPTEEEVGHHLQGCLPNRDMHGVFSPIEEEVCHQLLADGGMDGNLPLNGKELAYHLQADSNQQVGVEVAGIDYEPVSYTERSSGEMMEDVGDELEAFLGEIWSADDLKIGDTEPESDMAVQSENVSGGNIVPHLAERGGLVDETSGQASFSGQCGETFWTLSVSPTTEGVTSGYPLGDSCEGSGSSSMLYDLNRNVEPVVEGTQAGARSGTVSPTSEEHERKEQCDAWGTALEGQKDKEMVYEVSPGTDDDDVNGFFGHDANMTPPEADMGQGQALDSDLLKRQKRLMRNREAAIESRKRKKMYEKELEVKCRLLESQCSQLRHTVAVAAIENSALRAELDRVKSIPSVGSKFGVVEPAVLESDSLPWMSLPHHSTCLPSRHTPTGGLRLVACAVGRCLEWLILALYVGLLHALGLPLLQPIEAAGVRIQREAGLNRLAILCVSEGHLAMDAFTLCAFLRGLVKLKV